MNAAGYAFVSGTTSSSDFPVVAPLQSLLGGVSDMFAVVLDTTGASLIFSTYYGGSSGREDGYGIALDGSGRLFMTGSTNSTDFPTTAGTFQPAYGTGSGTDAVVVKLEAALPPPAPTGLSAVAQSASNVLVSWNAVSDATGYQVLRGCRPGGTFNPVPIATVIVTSFNDIGVLADTAYLYWVRAINAHGASALPFAVLANTTVFTDVPLLAGVTTIKAVHMNQLRTAANAALICAGQAAVDHSSDVVSPGTAIRAAQLADLFDSLFTARYYLGLRYNDYGFPPSVPPGKVVTAADFNVARVRACSGTQY